MHFSEYLNSRINNSKLATVLTDLEKGSIDVAKIVAKAGLLDVLGSAGAENVQGEDQQKLDVLADDIFIDLFRKNKNVAGIGSEENDNELCFEDNKKGEYVVLFDPLDGSSNIDVNVSIGTIFSIFKRVTPTGSDLELKDFLQAGTELVASGYTLYGTSTMIVLTTGNGVDAFTLDPEDKVFKLSHPQMKCKEMGKVYSMNEGNIAVSESFVQEYVAWCQETDKETNRPYSARYIGSLVADFHRNLIKGGIYIYPSTTKAPKGKLRLLYECAPLAFIAEQSGGLATDGKNRIMEIVPTELHQRVPYFVGSKKMVEQASK
jgi:fructose-1,6-bisphosphatase I